MFRSLAACSSLLPLHCFTAFPHFASLRWAVSLGPSRAHRKGNFCQRTSCVTPSSSPHKFRRQSIVTASIQLSLKPFGVLSSRLCKLLIDRIFQWKASFPIWTCQKQSEGKSPGHAAFKQWTMASGTCRTTFRVHLQTPDTHLTRRMQVACCFLFLLLVLMLHESACRREASL